MRKYRKSPEAAVPPAQDCATSIAGEALVPAAVPVMEERMAITKREVGTGAVRVTTKTETHEEIAEATLSRDAVEVVRVPIDRPIDVTPPFRMEGDTTIMPVVEERLILVKQLVLVEELHIRHRLEHETVRTPVQLRRQRAIVEHLRGSEGDDPEEPTELLS